MSIFSAMQEFSVMAQSILPVMKDSKIPREEKRETLCNMVDSLTEDTFMRGIVATMIMKIINMKEDVCKEYEDTQKHVDGILEWLPRMREHRERLTKEVEKNRKKYGLKL